MSHGKRVGILGDAGKARDEGVLLFLFLKYLHYLALLLLLLNLDKLKYYFVHKHNLL